MRSIYRRIVGLVRNGTAWWLDYIYVAYWQVYGFFVRSNPHKYAKSDSGAQQRIPIILLPGIYENWRFMRPIARLLHREGHPVHIVEGLGYNTGDVEDMAAIVDTYIASAHISRCIIVAHSKGGLIGKYLLTHHNKRHAIQGMIALNTPFSGSKFAYLIPLRSIRIFLPRSPIIALLAKNFNVNHRIVSVYGVFDPHIPKGSYLEGAHNVQLATRGHFRIMKYPAVHEAILKGIDELHQSKQP